MALASGILTTGRKWQVIESRKKAPGLVAGQHLVLTLTDNISANELTLAERVEILGVAERFAMERNGGNYRIAYNGPELGTRKHLHVHIMLPSGGDKLPAIVERIIS